MLPVPGRPGVPLIVTIPDVVLRDGGILGDVAPTLLQLLGVEQPSGMTGQSLIENRAFEEINVGETTIGTAESTRKRLGLSL